MNASLRLADCSDSNRPAAKKHFSPFVVLRMPFFQAYDFANPGGVDFERSLRVTFLTLLLPSLDHLTCIWNACCVMKCSDLFFFNYGDDCLHQSLNTRMRRSYRQRSLRPSAYLPQLSWSCNRTGARCCIRRNGSVSNPNVE